MSKLTRSELVKKSETHWFDSGLDELERLGVILPDPPEPKKLTALEACSVIARGGRVKDIRGHEYPDHNGSVNLINDCKPFTEIKKTIEIDVEVWVHKLDNGECTVTLDPVAKAGEVAFTDMRFGKVKVVACVPVRIKETVEIE